MLLMLPGSFPLKGVVSFLGGSEQLLKGHNIRVLMIKGYVYEIMTDFSFGTGHVI